MRCCCCGCGCSYLDREEDPKIRNWKVKTLWVCRWPMVPWIDSMSRHKTIPYIYIYGILECVVVVSHGSSGSNNDDSCFILFVRSFNAERIRMCLCCFWQKWTQKDAKYPIQRMNNMTYSVETERFNPVSYCQTNGTWYPSRMSISTSNSLKCWSLMSLAAWGNRL